MRGTPLLWTTGLHWLRFIPACAGNTPSRETNFTPNSVHPRVCGEHPPQPGKRSAGTGSSPRVRGTRGEAAADSVGNRFIPACAGNTSGPPSAAALNAVHPRVCGEHLGPGATRRRFCGSSPRVRGTRCPGYRSRSGGRFIPACAGNTLSRPDRQNGAPVHPRVCGEHRSTYAPRENPVGSSPRVRGTRAAPARPAPAPRFIPACAGNTRGLLCHRPGQPVHPRVCGEHAEVQPID